MTKREIFNKVRSHLLAQKRTSITETGFHGRIGCAYRGNDGTACAVGCLIDDEHYRPECEGKSIASNEVSSALLRSGVDSYDHYYFLHRLQSIHDSKHPSEWARLLEGMEKDEFTR